LIVNTKNDLDFAFRHVFISLHFLFTVEECWRQGMLVIVVVLSYLTHSISYF